MKYLTQSLVAVNAALLLFVYRLYTLYSTQHMYEGSSYYKYKFSYLDEVEDSLDTGDILLFSAYEFSAIRVLSSARFSHAAMVVRDNKGNIKGVDMLDNDFVAPGVMVENIHVFDIRTRVMYYAGFVYVSKCHKQLSKKNKEDIEQEVFNREMAYPSKQILICKYLLNTKNSSTNNFKSCVEFVVHLLKTGNVADLSRCRISDFMHRILLLADGNLYSKPLRLLVRYTGEEKEKNKDRFDLCTM